MLRTVKIASLKNNYYFMSLAMLHNSMLSIFYSLRLFLLILYIEIVTYINKLVGSSQESNH